MDWGGPWGALWGDSSSVDEIHQQEHNVGGWVIFIEGVREAFTNIEALVGSGAGSWIGTEYGDREILPGLEVPDLPLGTSVPFDAMITEARPSFEISDFDGRVRQLFAEVWDDTGTDYMTARLAPTDDPAPEETLGPGEVAIGLWGRHIGTEAIGPAGERRYYWIEPVDAPPGLDHPAGGNGRPPSTVTDEPRIWAGRMVAVYRIVRDANGDWPAWTEQHAGGSLWWVGRLKGRGHFKSGRNGERILSLPCSSVGSLLRKPLNLGRPAQWITCLGSDIDLSGDATKVAMWIGTNTPQTIDGGGINVIPGTYDCQTLASGNTLSGLTERADIVAKLQAILGTMISGSDTGGVLASTNAEWVGPNLVDQGPWQSGGSGARAAQISDSGGQIKIKCEEDSGAADGFYLAIALDARIWQLLGWDIADLNYEGGNFNTMGGAYWGEDNSEAYFPSGHYVGYFSTRIDPSDTLGENDGNYAIYTAPYPGGVMILDNTPGTVVLLQFGEVVCDGQLGQPYTFGSQIDSVDVDTSGWWIFRGQRLTAEAYLAGDDPEDYMAVALCEWVGTSSGDGIQPDSDGIASLKVIRWEDPRALGLPFDPMTEPWVGALGGEGGIEAAPLAVFGGIALGSYSQPAAPDWRHRLIPRILLSSGTAVWSESGGEVLLTAGDNHPADLPANDKWAGDIEVADLGLGLPRNWVDWASWYACAAKMPGGSSAALNRVTYASLGPLQAETLLKQAMGGAGWAWSWKRDAGAGPPAFGCWDPIAPLSLEDLELTLSRSTSAAENSTPGGGPQWRAVVELRDDGPFDRFEFEVDGTPLGGSTNYQMTHESLDRGRRYRDGKLVWTVEDGGLRDPTPWAGTPQLSLYEWRDQARERFASGFGEHYSRSARVYRTIVDATYTTRIGLGTVVRIIDPTAESPDGSLGLDHLGRVIEATIVVRGNQHAVKIAVLLQPWSVSAITVWGTVARAGRGSWDSGTNTMTVIEDWASVGGSHHDLLGMVAPAWYTGASGLLRVAIYQSEDGLDYPAGMVAKADVASVDQGANAISLTNISGTIYRDTIKWIVGAPSDEQTANWALAIYAPTTDHTGYFDGSKGKTL